MKLYNYLFLITSLIFANLNASHANNNEPTFNVIVTSLAALNIQAPVTNAPRTTERKRLDSKDRIDLQGSAFSPVGSSKKSNSITIQTFSDLDSDLTDSDDETISKSHHDEFAARSSHKPNNSRQTLNASLCFKGCNKTEDDAAVGTQKNLGASSSHRKSVKWMEAPQHATNSGSTKTMHPHDLIVEDF